MLLAQFPFRHIGRRAVLAGTRGTISHEMLDRGADVVLVDVVGVRALEALDHSPSDHGIDQTVLTEVLPHARPAGIARQVDRRRISPGAVGGSGLIGRDRRRLSGQVNIERCTQIGVLREHGTTQRVGGTVVLVQAVNTRDTACLERILIDGADGLLPPLGRL